MERRWSEKGGGRRVYKDTRSSSRRRDARESPRIDPSPSAAPIYRISRIYMRGERSNEKCNRGLSLRVSLPLIYILPHPSCPSFFSTPFLGTVSVYISNVYNFVGTIRPSMGYPRRRGSLEGADRSFSLSLFLCLSRSLKSLRESVQRCIQSLRLKNVGSLVDDARPRRVCLPRAIDRREGGEEPGGGRGDVTPLARRGTRGTRVIAPYRESYTCSDVHACEPNE